MSILEITLWIVGIYLGISLLKFLISVGFACYLLKREEREVNDR